jgi:hypothetical protein
MYSSDLLFASAVKPRFNSGKHKGSKDLKPGDIQVLRYGDVLLGLTGSKVFVLKDTS